VLRSLLCLFALCGSVSAGPNVLVLMSDDQGWWDLGANGNPDISTPNLDRLAAEGVNLTRFYAAPVCAPTRAGLMTGRYALRVGVYNTRFGGDSLALDETTLAEHLRAAGYRTGIFGKWHLGGRTRYRPENRGFDEALVFTHGHTERYYYPELAWNGRPVKARGYVTDVVSDAALAFMRQSEDERPFFAFVPYNTPHSPHFVDDRFLAPYLDKGLALRDARIYGQISQMDASIGGVLDALDAANLADDTIVLFLGDNGGISRHTRLGLRGGKASPFEGGIRTPFLARWPEKIPAGEHLDAMVSHLDVFPTLCELLGIDPPAGVVFDGKSFAPLLLAGEGESPHDYLVHSWDRHRPRLDRGWSVTGRRWKLTYDGLYDLENDPGEERDVAAEHPHVAAELRQVFVDWMADVTAGQRFQPPPIRISGGGWIEIPMSWARVNGTHTTWGSPGSEQTGGPDRLGDPPPDATTVNYAFAAYDWDVIESWRRPGESVRWAIEVADPGVYEVEATYGCDPADAGGTLRLTAGHAALEAAVKATPSRTVFVRRKLGRLRFEAGADELAAQVVETPGKELMTLNQLRLRRVRAGL